MTYFHCWSVCLAAALICYVTSNGASASQLSGAKCSGTSVVTVVAHQDDDLLFVDPAIAAVGRAGGCVTTIFIIGGASTAGFDYVLKNENASKRAYARMMGVVSDWHTDTVAIGDVHLARATLRRMPNIAMIFLRIKGGNVRGGTVPLADIFDASASVQSWPYTDKSDGPTNTFIRIVLVSTIKSLIEGYCATQVYALNPDTVPYVEHPDHIYSARVTRAALRSVSRDLSLYYHETYSTSGKVPNAAPDAVQFKRDVVSTYFQHERGGLTEAAFGEHQYYGNWIARRYFTSEHDFDAAPVVNPVWGPVVNAHTQQCLRPGGLGNVPFMDGCTSLTDEQWAFVPTSVAAGSMGTALLQNRSGHCVANRNGALVEEVCNGADIAQHWTPWDFGKIFVPGGREPRGQCLDASTASLIGDCSRTYPSTALWTREVTNVGSDLHVEVAMVGDLTGDGTERLIQVHRRTDGPGIDVWVSSLTGGSTSLESTKWYDSPVRFSSEAPTPTCTGNELCYDQTRYLVADFDGNGKDDILAISPAAEAGTAFWLFRSDGSSFAAPVLWALATGKYSYNLAHQYLVGDFDGNEKPDVMIAHSRGDSGLDFWVMINDDGLGLEDPVLWAEATELRASAQLFSAHLDTSGRTGVIAVDDVNGLRLSMFKSTGTDFNGLYGVRREAMFHFARSRVLIVEARDGELSDVWVLHARADGTDIDAWSMSANASGFDAPVFKRRISGVPWSNSHAYIRATPEGRTMLIVHRVDAPVREYSWLSGSMAVEGLRLSATGLDGDLIKFGESNLFEWTNLAWRNRLNR